MSVLQTDSEQLHPNDSTDITTLFQELTSTVHEHFPRESPQRICWDQQCKYNSQVKSQTTDEMTPPNYPLCTQP